MIKRIGLLILVAALAMGGGPVLQPSVLANPDYSHTENGDIQIQAEGPVYNITASNQAIGAFNSFSNVPGETINSIQAAADYTALYRVIGVEPSTIFGALNANSRIFLLNPSGILFGPDSQVNAPGLVASTLALSNQDFLAGNYAFEQDPSRGPGFILNQGQINAGPGGFVALLAGAVRNEGTITAPGGQVALAAGKKVTLSLDSTGLVSVEVNAALDAAVYDFEGNRIKDAIAHLGTISADEGYVVLSAKAVEGVFDNAINVSGLISATSVAERGGVIELLAADSVENTGELGWQNNEGKVQDAQGNVVVSGTLDVSSEEDGAQSGEVTVAGERVGLSGTIKARGNGGNGGDVLLTSTKQTLVTGSGTIDTSGTGTGSAGNVVVWSDKLTRFFGSITGRGGEQGGNGAQVEISGHESLQAHPVLDLLAPDGQIGSVLYDPLKIRLIGGLFDGSDDTDPFGTNLINDSGSNVLGTIDFADEGFGAPDPFLVFESEIEGTNADIILRARESIDTFGLFSNDSGEGLGVVRLNNNRSLTMETRNDAGMGDGPGSIDLTGSVHGNDLEFQTQGIGGITILGSTSGVFASGVTVGKLTTLGTGDITVATNNGTVTVNGALRTADTASDSGDVTIAATGDINLNASVTTGDDTVSSTAGANAALTGNISVTSTLGAITGNGSAVLTTGDATVDAFDGNSDTATSGNILLSALNAIQLAAGNTLTIGSATVANANGSDTATTGNAALTGAKVSSDGASGAVDVSFGTASGGNTNNSGTAAVTTTGGVGNAGGIFFTSGEALRLGALVTDGGSAQNLSVSTTGGAALTVTNAAESLSGDSVTLDSGTGTLTVADSSYTVGAGTLTLTGDEIDLTGGADSVIGTGSVTLQPSAAGVSIGVAGGAGTLALTAGDIAALKNGFSGITIGRADGAGGLTINAVTFYDPTTLRSPIAGTIAVNGQITGADDASITLDGAGATTNLGAGIVTAGTAISISDSVRLIASNPTLDTTNSGGSPAGAAVTISGTTDADASANNRSLTINAGTGGNATLTGAVGASEPLFGLTITANDISLPSVVNVKGGGLNLTSSGLMTLLGDISSVSGATAGDLNFTGNLILGANVLLNTNSAGVDGHILINGTVNADAAANNRTFGLQAGSGDASVLGAIGNTQAIESLTVNANEVSLSSVTTRDGGISVVAAGAGSSITLNGNLSTTHQAVAGAVSLDGPITLGSDVQISANAGGTDADITIFSTVNADAASNNRDLTLDSGTGGDINIGGNVGGTNAVDGFTITGADSASIQSLFTKGNVQITTSGATLTLVGSDIDTTKALGGNAGDVTFTGGVRLVNNVKIKTDHATGTDGNVTVNNALDADLNTNNRTLIVEAGAGGDVTFTGAVGGTQALDSFSISSADTASVSSVRTRDGGITITATGITFSGGTLRTDDENVTGAATFNGPITLGGATTLDTNSALTDAQIQFNSTVNGANDLSIDSGTQIITFNGAVGNLAPIGDGVGAALQLLSTGAATFNSTLAAASGMTAVGDVTFTGNVTLGNGDTASSFASNVTLDGLDFTAADGATFGDNAASDLVTLSGGPVSVSATASPVIFRSRVDGAQDLTLGGSGNTTFEAAVGSTAALGDGTGAALTINSTGATELQSTVRLASGVTQAGAAGAVTFRDDVNVTGGNTDNTFNANVVLDGLTFTSAKATTFGNTGADTLTISGAATTVDTSAAAVNVTLNSATTLGVDLTVSAGLGGITQAGTVNGNNDLVYNSSGTTAINGAIGGVTPIATLITDALGVTNIGASISAQGGTLTFNDPVNLTGPATLTDTGGTGVTFGQTVNGANDLTLAVSGATNFNGNVGNVTPVGDGTGAALIINSGGATNFNGTVATGSGITQANGAGLITFKENVTVSGGVPNTFNANVLLDGLTFTSNRATTFGNAGVDTLTISTAPVVVNTSGGPASSVVVNSATTLNEDLTVTAGANNITTNGTINGNNDLVLNSGGTTRINGRVGGVIPIATLTTNAPGTTELNNSIDAQGGTMTFNDAVELISSLTLTDTGGTGINFNNTVDGEHDLTLNVAGTTNFNDQVGDNDPLGDGTGAALIINSGGPTNFNDTVTINSGIRQANGAGLVTFFEDVTVQGGGNTANTFNANVVLDGLTFTSDQETTFGNGVGPDTLVISDDPVLVDTSGDDRNVVINSATTLNEDLTVSAGEGDITTNGVINGNTALEFNSEETTRINGVIGGLVPIFSLTTDSDGVTELNANITADGSTMTFNDAVQLISSILLTELSGDVTFNNTVDGEHDLTLDVAGTTNFNDEVGDNVALGDGAGAALIINSAGATNFNDTVTTNSGITQANGAGLVTFRENVTVSGGDTPSTFNANVRLDGLTFTSDGSATFGNAGTDQVTLSGNDVILNLTDAAETLTVNSRVSGARDLTFMGAATGVFNGRVGTATRIGDGSGAALILDSTGPTTFNSTVRARSGIFQADTAGLVTFRDDVTITGDDTDTTFNANVLFDGLETFESEGAITFGNAGTDTLVISASNPVLVDTSGDDRNVVINSATTLNEDLTVSAGQGDITTNGVINGNNALELNSSGTTRINGVIGGLVPIFSLTTDSDGVTELNANITADGSTMTFNDAVELISSILLTELSGDVTFNNTVDGEHDLTLNVAGTTNFNDEVGDNVALGDGTGAALIINSAGPTNFNSRVRTGSGITQADGAGLVTFEGDVEISGGDTPSTFNANVLFNGLEEFTSDGAVTFGDEGTDTLVVDDESVEIDTSGGAGSHVVINSATTLNEDLMVNTGANNITTNGTIDGHNDLVFNSSGTTRINGEIGGLDPIESLTTDAPGVTELNANITADGSTMEFNDPVELISSVVLTELFGDVTFNDTVDGANDLTLDVAGTTNFNGNVGATTPVGDGMDEALIINSGGATNFNGTVATSSGIHQDDGAGLITFTEDVTVGAGDTDSTFDADVTLDEMTFSTAGSATFGNSGLLLGTDQVTLSGGPVTVETTANNGSLVFNSLVDGAEELTLATQGTGDITFNSPVGGAAALISITVNQADDVSFNSTVTTTGNLTQTTGTGTTTFADTATIGGDADVSNGSIAFSGPAGSLMVGAGANPAVLNALTGTITSGAAASDVTASTLVATAAAGIATQANPLRITVGNIEFAGGTGGAYLFDTASGLIIGGIGALANGGSATGGNIVAQASSPLTVDSPVVNTGGGNTTLEALGAADTDDVTLNANVTNSGGNGSIEINAGDDVAISAGVTVSTTGTGSVTIRAGQDATDGATDAPDGNADGNITMTAPSTIQTEEGNITLDATNGTVTHIVNANSDGDGVRGDVTITARGTAGIQDTGAAALITADDLTLTSGGNIGTLANPLNLAANALTAAITGLGDMFFSVIGNILINLSAPNGDIEFSTDGVLTVGLASAPLGHVILGGSSIIAPVPSGTGIRLIALEFIRLLASTGTIGTPGDPLRYNMLSETPIQISAGGSLNGLSVNLLGNLPTPNAVSIIGGVATPGLILHQFRSGGVFLGGQNLGALRESTSELFVPVLPLANRATGQVDGRFRDFPGIFNLEPFVQPVPLDIDERALGVPAPFVRPVPLAPPTPVPPVPVPVPPTPVPPLVEEKAPAAPAAPRPAPRTVTPAAPAVTPAPEAVPTAPQTAPAQQRTAPVLPEILPQRILPGPLPGGFLPPTRGDEGKQTLPPTGEEEQEEKKN